MSLASWKKEFYQGRLRDAARSPLAAVEHSLRKWEGLRKVNLDAHGVVIECSDVVNPDTDTRFGIDCDSCALCKMCTSTITSWRGSLSPHTDCDKCPIVLATGEECDGGGSPYDKWVDFDDPVPMIAALNAARVYLLQHEGRK